MKKILQYVEAFFAGIAGFAKANPALAAGVVSIAVTLLARFGLHVSTNELTVIVSTLSALLAGLVHVSTRPAPAGEHEKP